MARLNKSIQGEYTRIGIALENDTIKALGEISKVLGTNTSELIRNVLKQYIQSKDKDLQEYRKMVQELEETRNRLSKGEF